jgi:hypothetical protein
LACHRYVRARSSANGPCLNHGGVGRQTRRVLADRNHSTDRFPWQLAAAVCSGKLTARRFPSVRRERNEFRSTSASIRPVPTIGHRLLPRTAGSWRIVLTALPSAGENQNVSIEAERQGRASSAPARKRVDLRRGMMVPGGGRQDGDRIALVSQRRGNGVADR